MNSIAPALDPSSFSNMNFKDFSRVTVHNARDGACEESVEFNVEIDGCNLDSRVRVSLKELNKFDFRSIDPRIRFNVADKTANRHLADFIRDKLNDNEISKREEYKFETVGMFKLQGDTVFCVGNDVITSRNGNASSLEFDTQCVPENLDVDTQLNEADAAGLVLEVICICHSPGAIIIAQQITYVLRQAFVDVGINPCLCVFLYGESGKRKTTVSGFLTQLYARNDGIKSPVRLNASIPAAINLILNARDCVVVLDDLFPAKSKELRRKQEETLSEIVRCIADGTTPSRMKGGLRSDFKPMCGVLFTGEYLIGEGSDAARIIPVEMEDIDGEKLKYFQDNPLFLSTFYYYFIQWAVDNYNDIVGFLRNKLGEYRCGDLGIHPRLQESLYFLDTSYYLMLSYFCEKGIFLEDEAIVLHRAFLKRVTEIVKCQNRRVEKNVPISNSTVDYWEHICCSFREGKIYYAEDYSKYQNDVHDAVIHANCLCIRGDWFATAFPNAKMSKIADSLNELGVLEKGTKSFAKQISQLNGKRFYFIKLDALKE